MTGSTERSDDLGMIHEPKHLRLEIWCRGGCELVADSHEVVLAQTTTCDHGSVRASEGLDSPSLHNSCWDGSRCDTGAEVGASCRGRSKHHYRQTAESKNAGRTADAGKLGRCGTWRLRQPVAQQPDRKGTISLCKYNIYIPQSLKWISAQDIDLFDSDR